MLFSYVTTLIEYNMQLATQTQCLMPLTTIDESIPLMYTYQQDNIDIRHYLLAVVFFNFYDY